ncbi:acetoacetate decarboxylase family protein [Mycolicibacterium sp. YH-1]|uniref:acetoacetate decarboxylase family protein n=1 Tax=Mycolicibacterium sp. YH-1 TaxID=2908837 RepID=UPI001F4C0718|nr:acetoacetate decarboxylase family protein [Mycolicibacterium sp. YH-1]UNB52930.1 acetoacetate decarboxylase family protein [Mycolicibacterium sp. YH-1]
MEFSTTSDFVASVLPPTLTPTRDPIGFAAVSRWQGLGGGAMDIGAVCLAVMYGDIPGWYTLSLIVNSDMGVAWGREMWGECKKLGNVDYRRDGRWFTGYAQRHGVRIIEIEARLDTPEETVTEHDYAFEIKGFPQVDGQGLEEGTRLVTLKSTAEVESSLSGPARLTLRGNGFDPLDTVPVVSIGDAQWKSGTSTYEAVASDLVDGQSHLPYLLGRQFDDRSAVEVPLRFRGDATEVAV